MPLRLAPFALLFAFAAPTLHAQTQAAPPTLPNVPTTRILAVGHLTPGTTREAVMPILKQEVPDTLKLYLAGKIDQWYSRRDQNGVVFLVNVSTVEEARSILAKLPLGQAHLMEFDLIPLGPLAPLGLLLGTGAPAPAPAPAR